MEKPNPGANAGKTRGGGEEDEFLYLLVVRICWSVDLYFDQDISGGRVFEPKR